MIEGWTKERARIPDNRSPFTPEILVQLSKSWVNICRNNFEISLFRATFLVAFFGALWVSEVVAASKADKLQVALQKEDIQVVDSKIYIHIRPSKMDQRAQGMDIVLGQCSIAEICPAQAVVAYLQLRGEHSGYFICHRDGLLLLQNTSFGD